jgi:Spy/CpxP family protein refolding chaperone
MTDLQKQIEPQFQAIREETRAQIRQVLDPSQAKKFDEFIKQVDERRRRRGPPPPP